MFTTTGWAEAASLSAIISYAMAYGGFAQMVAGVLELIKGNTFAGTAFFSYGECWLTCRLAHLQGRGLHRRVAPRGGTAAACGCGCSTWCMHARHCTATGLVVANEDAG